jgi:Methylamine utilisation protein MauE
MPNRFSNYYVDVISGLLILLWVYTATSKLIDIESFQRVLSQLALMRHWAEALAWIISILEILIAGLLFFPPTRVYGLFVSLLLLAVFTLYVAGMLWLAPTLPCSCGGVISELGWREHLVFNSVATGLALWGWKATRRKKRITLQASS